MGQLVVGGVDLKELEARGRYLRRRSFGGYRAEDVDAFLVEVNRALRAQLDENEALRSGVSPERLLSTPSSERMTPFDVQDRRFHRARVGGYDMRSVDEYLDDITEVLTALTLESETLRHTSSEHGREDVSR